MTRQNEEVSKGLISWGCTLGSLELEMFLHDESSTYFINTFLEEPLAFVIQHWVDLEQELGHLLFDGEWQYT